MYVCVCVCVCVRVCMHVRAQARAKPAPSPRRGRLRTLEVLRARDQGVVNKQLPPAQRLVGAADGMPWRDARLGQLRAAQYLLEMGAEVNALNRMGYADSGTVARNRTRVE